MFFRNWCRSIGPRQYFRCPRRMDSLPRVATIRRRYMRADRQRSGSSEIAPRVDYSPVAFPIALGRRSPLDSSSSAMRSPARPSPKGFAACAICVFLFSASHWAAVSTINFLDVPTSFAHPDSIASGRSVTSRSTRTGVPTLGASSCTPPESLRIKSARRIRCTNSGYVSGAVRITRGVFPRMRPATSRTAGFGCTGKTAVKS